ncbi:terminase large subunit [Ruminococcaceae bacterium OttesenSCG-928-I18]|nr:terminase large subunit [Ruminococcaceae bacterium OttesenSCG-928-I18]
MRPGGACYVGIDLSSGGDLTSIALDFDITDMVNTLPIEIPPADTPQPVSYLYSHSFMPKGRLDEHIKTDFAPYDEWANEGLITITGGDSDFKNDYKFIVNHLREIQEKYDLTFLGIAYDPHNADAFLSDLEEFGAPLLEVKQSARYLNDATEDIRLEIKSGRTLHDRRNALLTWSMANAKTTKNSFGEIKVDKEPTARKKRIDPVDACIDARTMRIKMPQGIDAAAEMEKYLERMGWKKTDAEPI